MITYDEQKGIIGQIKSGDYVKYNLPAPISNNGHAIGTLVPIIARDVDEQLCQHLYEWRERHADLFLTVFKNSPLKVEEWLRTTALPDLTRLSFKVLDDTREMVGMVGLCELTPEAVELDTMIRGSSRGHQALMRQAQTSLLDWTFETLDINTVTGRVLAKNILVRRFHSSFGFRERTKTALIKELTTDGYKLTPAPQLAPEAGDDMLIQIVLTRPEFAAAAVSASRDFGN